MDYFAVGGSAAALLAGAFALRGLAILVVAVAAAWSRTKGKRDSAVEALGVLCAPRILQSREPRSGLSPTVLPTSRRTGDPDAVDLRPAA
jgi:hypothetical protein